MSERLSLRVAAVQMCSGPDLQANLEAAGQLLRQAQAAGAQMAVLPENFALQGRSETDKLALAEPPGTGPIQAFLAEQARTLGMQVVGGSVPMQGPDEQHVLAACLVYGPQGELLGRYDKMHLFDVDTMRDGRAERYAESNTIAHGPVAPTVVSTGLAALGLSICYDLRFPELYRALLDNGAPLLLVPSAFKHQTGEAHWLPLLRARAIENQCAVIAPNQCGPLGRSRRTWGHSMVIDAWGQVLAQCEESPGCAVADIDMGEQTALRERFPVLKHRRMAP